MKKCPTQNFVEGLRQSPPNAGKIFDCYPIFYLEFFSDGWISRVERTLAVGRASHSYRFFMGQFCLWTRIYLLFIISLCSFSEKKILNILAIVHCIKAKSALLIEVYLWRNCIKFWSEISANGVFAWGECLEGKWQFMETVNSAQQALYHYHEWVEFPW